MLQFWEWHTHRRQPPLPLWHWNEENQQQLFWTEHLAHKEIKKIGPYARALDKEFGIGLATAKEALQNQIKLYGTAKSALAVCRSYASQFAADPHD
jgi:hypothetical protein